MTFNSIVADYKRYWSEKFSNLRMDNNIFKNIKQLSNYKKHLELPQIMLTGGTDPTQVNTNIDKANAFANHFVNAHNLTLNMGDDDFGSTVSEYINGAFVGEKITDFANNNMNELSETRENNVSKNFVFIDDVISAIKSRNSKKSYGNDGISNFVLKKIAGKRLCETLLILFNHIINNSYTPRLWREAIIMAIPKPGRDPNIISNYRPISKISCIAKVLEKIQTLKLQSECDNLNIKFDAQYGFRAGRTTCHALFKLTTNIANNLNIGIPTHLVALDFEKAYDTVWIERLIYKMRSLGFGIWLCNYLLNYLKNRTFKVQVGNSISNAYSTPAGIPQGSVISCILFIIYVVDFPMYTGPLRMDTTQFADDTLISVHCENADLVSEELNEYLTIISSYLNKWRIKINTEKCEEIAIVGNIKQTKRNTRKNARKIEIRMNNEVIPKTNNLKYLGIYLSRNFKFNFHVEKIRKKMLAAYFSLKNMFSNRLMEKSIKLLIYKQIIRPIALYGAPIWLQVTGAQINKIALLERKMLRAASQLYRRPDSVKYYANQKIYDECGINPIEKELIERTIKFIDKLYTDGDFRDYVTLNEMNDSYLGNLHYYNSKPPIYIKYLEQKDKLFLNGNEIYYKNLPTLNQFRFPET